MRTKKKAEDPNFIFPVKRVFVAFCGGCGWHFTDENLDTCLERLNTHLEKDGDGEGAYTDSKILVADKQVQLGLKERKELTIGRA